MAKAFFPPENLTTNERINYLANIKTTARRLFVGKLFDDQRQHQVPPSDGMYKRYTDQVNAKLDAMESKQMEQLGRIEQNTDWLSRWLANIFKGGAGEAEKKYPSKKR